MQPELALTHGDRAFLTATAATDGYKVIHRIMRTEVDKFILALVNADPSQPEQVLTRHLLAKAAAQFYAASTERINEEILQYTGAPKASDKPLDMTAGLIDLCDEDIEAAITDVENLLGEERG